MNYRPLGNTGLKVSEIALGGLYTSSLAGGVDETRRLLRRARELGVNYIDTAPAYADSEQTLGAALGDLRDEFLISTKLGGRPQPFAPQDGAALAASFAESCALLGRERIDILMIHEPDRPQQYDWWRDRDEYAGPVLDLMHALQAQGRIGHTGLGGTTTTELARICATGKFQVLLTAFNYNALFREAMLELLPTAEARRMGVVAASVLGQGFLARRFDDEVRRRPCWLSLPRQRQLLDFYALLDDSGLTPLELSLRFVLSNPVVSCVLVGPKTASQLDACVQAAARGPLPADVAARLDAIAAHVPFRPFEEPMILPLGKAYYGPGMPNLGAAVKVGAASL